jgi:type II secretory pathway component PulJ
MKINNNKKKAMTMVELIFTMVIFVLLSGSIYQIFRAVNMTFKHSQDKLDILQTTRIIMASLRNDIRNAIKKPEVFNGKLNVTVAPNQTILYYFDETNRRLYKGFKEGETAPDPDISEMRPFMFNDGQILAFDYALSYHTNYAASELKLNSRVWCKVIMKVLYTEKYDKLSEEEKASIMENMDEDERVKTFFMVITPRKVNWLLQATD